MPNRIRALQIHDRRLVPVEVELGITVIPEYYDAATRITGRLVGPRCRYSSTVEVAYPLGEVHRNDAEDGPRIFLRLVIPEASFWEPATPFLYRGPVELWQGNNCCDAVTICRGFRFVSLGKQGLRVNGKLLPFQGAFRDELSQPAAEELRKAGTNVLIVSLSSATAPAVWNLADEMGFLVLGRISAVGECNLAWSLQDHPSTLGWILEPGVLSNETLKNIACLYPVASGQLLGVRLSREGTTALPEGTNFVFCDERDMHLLENAELPLLAMHNPNSVELRLQSTSDRLASD
jgi:hypothetical protein